MKIKNFIKVCLFIWTFLLIACGYEYAQMDVEEQSVVFSSSSITTSSSLINLSIMVSSREDLPICDESRRGDAAYSMAERITYVCNGTDWEANGVAAPSSDESSSSFEKEVSSSSFAESSSSSLAMELSSSSSSSFVYGSLRDSRDKKVYKTVKIGEQTWMAENLNYEINDEEESWCGGRVSSFGDKGDCDSYGRLYTWTVALNTCPEGWRLPSNEDWIQLWKTVGGEGSAGEQLKSNDRWGNPYGLDTYGFGAIPAGIHEYNSMTVGGVYVERFADYRAYYWSATFNGANNAYYWYFDRNSDEVVGESGTRKHGMSIRCIEGEIPTSPSKTFDYGSFTDLRDNHTYKTIKIGPQTWFAENLTYNPLSNEYPTYCPDGKANNCTKYGRLYSFEAAVAACPHGWKLPTYEEWRVFSNSTDQLRIKSNKGWYANGNGEDDYGFSAFPAGAYMNSTYRFFGEEAYFWSSNVGQQQFAYSCHTSYVSETGICDYNNIQSYGLSVRCMKEKLDEKSFVDERDGHIYHTTTLGGMTWMSENLNYGDFEENELLKTQSKCYDDNEFNCKKFGRLYSWAAVLDSVKNEGPGTNYGWDSYDRPKGKIQGICPNGWHIPSYEEYRNMLSATNGSSVKSVHGWVNRGDGSGYGISILPAGIYGGTTIGFDGVGIAAYQWTSSLLDVDGKELAAAFCWQSNGDDAFECSIDRRYLLSVRCVKD